MLAQAVELVEARWFVSVQPIGWSFEALVRVQPSRCTSVIATTRRPAGRPWRASEVGDVGDVDTFGDDELEDRVAEQGLRATDREIDQSPKADLADLVTLDGPTL